MESQPQLSWQAMAANLINNLENRGFNYPSLPTPEALEHLELLMEQLQMVQHIANQGYWLTTNELAMLLNLPTAAIEQIIAELERNHSNKSSQNPNLDPAHSFPWRNFRCYLILKSSSNSLTAANSPSQIFWQIAPEIAATAPYTTKSEPSKSLFPSPKSNHSPEYITPQFELIHYPITNYTTSTTANQITAQPANTTQTETNHISATIAPILFTEANAFAQAPSEIIPIQFLQIDNFLSWQQLRDLFRYTIDQETNFVGSINTNGDESYRRSQVLYQFPEFEALLKSKLTGYIEKVCEQLKIRSFIPIGIEAQLTAHNDGHFYKLHNDNGSPDTANRILTYVYYFHREPKGFSGGELVLYDGAMENNLMMAAHSSHQIQPRNNSIVFFPSQFMHEVLPIICPSRKFVDSRFTINGWVRGA
ncbi:MAG: 2OG-Fe(II) oxygenase [Pseudanabaena sp. ELA607]